MLQANTRTYVHEAVLAAHIAAHSAVSLFGEHHKLKDGKSYIDPEPLVKHGTTITHGIFGNSLDFIPLSAMLVGGKLSTKCKGSMKKVTVGEIQQLMKKCGIVDKDWRIGNVRVSVKKFMEPILKYLTQHAEQVEAFAVIYENKLTYTDVFGLVVVSKPGGAIGENMTWEITIDNVDLTEPLSVRGMFCRN